MECVLSFERIAKAIIQRMWGAYISCIHHSYTHTHIIQIEKQ